MFDSISPSGRQTPLHTPGQHGSGRLPYQRPHLRTIDLAAEEVLAVGCKMAGSAGPLSPASCLSSSCFAEGS